MLAERGLVGILQRVGLCLGLCESLGCEVWLDVDAPQCITSKDCVGLLGRGYTCGRSGVCLPPDGTGTATDGVTTADADASMQLPARWACANQSSGDFVSDPDKTVTIRMDAVDLNTLRVPADVVATACAPTDFGCDSPVQENVTPGPDGLFEFGLPYGWEGFLTFNGPDMVPGIAVFGKPFLASETTSGPALLTVKSLGDLSRRAGRELIPGNGIAIFEVRDCNDRAGDGVMFDSVAEQTPFYFDGALPSLNLSETTVSNLLAAGREPRAIAGFQNIPESYTTFRARLASNGAALASITIPIRADTITYVRLYVGY